MHRRLRESQLASSPIRPRFVRRRGVALLVFVTFLFIIFGMAALVIDLGVARTAQRQMQTAAKFSALEGLRSRDNGLANPRQDAHDAVALVFDDDLDPPVDPHNYGAGPTISFSPGGAIGEFQHVASIGVYKPDLQLNDGSGGPPANQPHGDMLTGTYDETMRHDEGYNPNPYDRNDFVPYAGGPAPNSFLVRIRRTFNGSGLDDIASVSSNGGGVPYLFGRGALLSKISGGSYDPRTDGISVGARAIADAQPVLTIGPASPPALSLVATGIEGVAPFAFDLGFWNLLPVGVPTPVRLQVNGNIDEAVITPGLRDGQFVRTAELPAPILASSTSVTVSSPLGFPAPPFTARIDAELMRVTAVAGPVWTVVRGVDDSVAAVHGLGSLVHLFQTSVVGEPVLNAAATTSLFPLDGQEVFVPVFTSVGGVERVVGYGRAVVLDPGALPPPYTFPFNMTVTKAPGMIAPMNASAGLTVPMDPSLTGPEVDQVFALRRTVADRVLAPALVRAYGQ